MAHDRLTRRRLLTLGGCGMIATALPWLPGCGGGSEAPKGPQPPGPGDAGLPGKGVPGTPVTAAERVAALDAVATAIAPATAGAVRFDAAALAGQLLVMPAFQRVGTSAAHDNVWALFTDGRALVVPNSLVPAGMSALGAPPPVPRSLPGARRLVAAAAADLMPSLLTAGQYRQLDMMGQVPVSASPDAAHLALDFVSQETLPRLRTLAVGRGFTLPPSQQGGSPPPDQGYDNGVVGLKGVSGDGVFFITASSAEIGATGEVAICVDTAATEANEALHAADLAAGLLTYAVAWRGSGTGFVPFPCLAITPAFARAHWSFPVQSLGLLNLTGGSMGGAWADALSSCGLKNLVYWEQPVGWKRMLAFADDLLQLLLATNDLRGTHVTQATEPRLRSYGLGATLGYLVRKRLTDTPQGAIALGVLQSFVPVEVVQTLIPSIDYVSIDEGRSMFELVGLFGAPQGAVSEVHTSTSPPGAFAEPLLSRAADGLLPGIDTLRTNVWNGDLIQSAAEPAALPGGGYLQVWNGGRCSNAVQITHWAIPMRALTTIAGGLTLDLTVTLHLRADVRGHRMDPDAPLGLARPVLPLETTLDSHASYVASGEVAETVGEITTTVTWSGAGAVSNAPGLVNVGAAGLLDWSARRLPILLRVLNGEPFTQRTRVTRPNPPAGTEVLSDVTAPGTVDMVAALASDGSQVALQFGAGWDLAGGSVELKSDTVTLAGTRTRTTVLSWGPVAADFPPEATVGGV